MKFPLYKKEKILTGNCIGCGTLTEFSCASCCKPVCDECMARHDMKAHNALDEITGEIIGVLKEARARTHTDECDLADSFIEDCIFALEYGEWPVCTECGEERSTADLDQGIKECHKCGHKTNQT